MKYCYECGRITTGEPLFCQFCGRSYNVKLCPRQHLNPRYAEVCSQCGSRELSTPQPKVSFWWHVLEYLIRIIAGVVLVYVSLSVLIAALNTQIAQFGLIFLILVVAIFWALWMMLPEWFRKLVQRVLKRKEGRRDR